MIGTIFTRDATTLVTLTRGESIGLAYTSLAGLASSLASVTILVLIARRIKRDHEWEALDVSVITLFAAEVIQGMAHAMNLKWVVEGKLETSPFCTAQGLFGQLGEVTVALATLTIAVQTFLIIWWLKPLSRAVSLRIIAVELIFVILAVGIGFGIHTRPPKEFYSAPTPYWCWIGAGFPRERIGLEYLWFWLTLFISTILYTLIFLLYLGVFTTGERWYSPRMNIRSNASQTVNGARRNMSILPSPAIPSTAAQVISGRNQLLWSTLLYPVLYCILVLPLTVVRFITFHEASTGKTDNRPAANIVVITIFMLSGVLNAILYRTTHRDFFQVDERPSPQAPESLMEIFQITRHPSHRLRYSVILHLGLCVKSVNQYTPTGLAHLIAVLDDSNPRLGITTNTRDLVGNPSGSWEVPI